MYGIDKDVPIPARGRFGGNKKYPFDTMEVGDSFFVACSSIAEVVPAQRNLAASWHRFRDKRFTSRGVNNDDQVGVRVWRIG